MRYAGRSAVVAAVGALVFAGAALAVTDGYYSGSTSQPRAGGTSPFSITVGHIRHHHGKYVTSIQYTANYTGDGTECASHFDGSPTRLSEGFKGIKIKGSKFYGGRVAVTRYDHVTISGHFQGRTVTGSFTEKFNPQPGARNPVFCSTGKVTFTAKLGSAPI